VTKIRLFIVIILALAPVACAPHIPTSQNPAEVRKKIPGSYAETWDSVMNVAKACEGTVVAQDKKAGIIVYKLADAETEEDVYMHVYMKGLPQDGKTCVVLFPQINLGYSKTSMSMVYSALRSRKAYFLTEIEADFFSRLEQEMGKDSE